MADKISYTINDWHKSDVLTAEKLNATEAALARVVAMINGNSGSQSVTLEKSELIASEAYVDEAINDLNYTPTEDEAHTPSAIKTIASLTESSGKINVTYQEIQKASGINFGVVKAGTNLSATDGTLSVIDSPTFSGSLTLDGAFDHSRKANEQLQAKVPHEALNAAYKTITLGATPASLQDGETWTGTITPNNASTITLQGYETIINTPLALNDNFTHSTQNLDTGTSVIVQPYGTFSAKYKNIVLGELAKQYRKSDGEYLGDQTSSSTNISLYGNSTSIATDKLNVSSTSTFSNSLTVGRKIVANDTTTLSGSTTLYGTINIEGSTTLLGALSVSGASTLSGGITTGNATITTANITEATMTIATAANATITDATITNINDGFTILHSNSNDENISLSTALTDNAFSVGIQKVTAQNQHNFNIFSIDLIPTNENNPESIQPQLTLQCPISIESDSENTNSVIMSANNGNQTTYSLENDGHLTLAQGITYAQMDTNNNLLLSDFYINYNPVLDLQPEMVLNISKGDTTWNIFTHNFDDTLLIGDPNINTVINSNLTIQSGYNLTIGQTTLTEQNLQDLLTLLS